MGTAVDLFYVMLQVFSSDPWSLRLWTALLKCVNPQNAAVWPGTQAGTSHYL